MSLQVLPLQTTKAYDRIDEVIRYIQSTGLTYEVGPFNTSLEGEFSQLLAVIEKAKILCLKNDVPKLIINVQFHFKNDQDCRLQDKTAKWITP